MDKNNPWSRENNNWSDPPEMNSDWVVRDLDIKKTDTVLDIGCGSGAYLNDIHKKVGCKCFGIDIISSAFKLNKNPELKLVYSDMRDVKFPDKSFDKIFSIGTFEHVKETDKVFSEVSRLLKKDGKVLFTVPNLYSFFHITKKIKQFLGLWGLGLEKSFTANELKKILESHDLHVERYYTVPHSRVSNIFNRLDNKLNRFSNKKFGFFVNVIAVKNE